MRAILFACLTLVLFLSPKLQSQILPTELSIKRSGAQQVYLGSSEYFTGSVVVEPLFQAAKQTSASGTKVTFMAGARTHWHSLPLGKTLILTEGRGLVQQWGQAVQEIRPGDVVSIPAGVKHWHGAVADSSATHYAIKEHLDTKAAEWLAPVTDSEYKRNVNF